jgi:transposase InsO family protein
MNIELKKLGYTFGIYKTASLMQEANVVALTPKKQHYYPNNGEECRYAPNLLKRQFNPETLNTHWVGDITYIRTNQGWSYLACVLDLSSREIVGWAVSQSPDAKLAKVALNNANKKHRPNLKNLMFHSDQGVQYSANLFTSHLARLKITQSMSRRGNCWDNAVMERFFRSLKSERLNHLTFTNHQSLTHCIESYIRFYNYRRLHSANNYLTPVQKANELKKVA